MRTFVPGVQFRRASFLEPGPAAHTKVSFAASPLAGPGFGKRVTQEQVAAAAPRVDHGPPQRIAWREYLAHDQAQSSVTGVAAGDLRRECQELLIDELFRVEVAQQSWSSLDEDSPVGAHPDNLGENGARRDRVLAPENCPNID